MYQNFNQSGDIQNISGHSDIEKYLQKLSVKFESPSGLKYLYVHPVNRKTNSINFKYVLKASGRRKKLERKKAQVPYVPFLESTKIREIIKTLEKEYKNVKKLNGIFPNYFEIYGLSKALTIRKHHRVKRIHEDKQNKKLEGTFFKDELEMHALNNALNDGTSGLCTKTIHGITYCTKIGLLIIFV